MLEPLELQGSSFVMQHYKNTASRGDCMICNYDVCSVTNIIVSIVVNTQILPIMNYTN